MKTAICAAFLMFLASIAQAQQRLTVAEIAAALTGNTVTGEINGKKFRQYFRNDGTTTFRRQGEGANIGKWRTDDEGHYCAWWATNGWSCYWMSRDGDTVTWHYEDKVAYPATLLPGEQMDF